MKRVDLPLDLFDKYPSELSGGMQQRIGVIRALAADQNIILMDEPFGALDPITRDSIQRLVKRLQVEMNKTIIFVTHDMDEALGMADKIVVMDEGKVIQVGTPKDILMHPANDFVKDLIGEDHYNQAVFEYETVQHIMRDPVKINENKTIAQAARLMRQTKVDDVLVVNDDDVLVGRIDMRALTRRNQPEAKVSSIMKQVTYITETTSFRDAIYYVQDLSHRNISVVDDEGHLKGIVTRADIVSSVYDAFWQNYEPDFEDEEDVVIDYEEISEKVSGAVEQAQTGGDSQ